MRVYLDACCLNRPFDDQTQDRIRLEAEAVLLILAHVEEDEWEWIGSQVLDYEVGRTPDPERRARVRLLLQSTRPGAPISPEVARRAAELADQGLGAVDALHVAAAEASHVDVLLTTDDGLLRAAHRLQGGTRVRVCDPLSWLREMTEK